MNGIHEGVANESYCLWEGQFEEKDYDTDIKEVTSLHTQYRSQHGKNEHKLKSEQGWCWKGSAKQSSNELGKKVPPRQYLNQLWVI